MKLFINKTILFIKITNFFIFVIGILENMNKCYSHIFNRTFPKYDFS